MPIVGILKVRNFMHFILKMELLKILGKMHHKGATYFGNLPQDIIGNNSSEKRAIAVIGKKFRVAASPVK